MDKETVKVDSPVQHRSPYTYELVDPTNAKEDKRKRAENVQARVRGRANGTDCGSEQLYANNDLSSDPVAVAAELDPDRLFRQVESNPPNFAIICEKPEHRIILYLKGQGLSNKEVAEKTGYTPAWVCQICRQPWFRLRLVQELKDAGQDQIQLVLKASALDSVYTIIDIRDDVTAPKAVRRACADSLLDRFLGKAVQKIESSGERVPSSPEISAVESELADIDRQLKEPESNGTPTS
jgi:hypothetical protein